MTSRTCATYFMRWPFLCNYELEKLFASESKCELFLKTCFLKINELFIQCNNWHIIDEFLFAPPPFTFNTECANNAYGEYIDFIRLLDALRSNLWVFKYFKNKRFFNFLKKTKAIYYLIENCMYSTSIASSIESILSALDYYHSSAAISNSFWNLSEDNSSLFASKTRALVQPLSLANLAKVRIKRSLKYLDVEMMAKLALLKYAINYLSNGLAKGLPHSFERAKMNKIFDIQKPNRRFNFSRYFLLLASGRFVTITSFGHCLIVEHSKFINNHYLSSIDIKSFLFFQ